MLTMQPLSPGMASPTSSACFLGFDSETQAAVTIPAVSRPNHLSLIGATGSGKSVLAGSLCVQDAMLFKRGVFYMAPDWKTIAGIISRLDETDLARVVLLDPGDATHALKLNLLHCTDIRNDLEVSRSHNRMMGVCQRLWGVGSVLGLDSWGAQLENILSSCFYTLIFNGMTLSELPYLLRGERGADDDAFRRRAVANIPPSWHWVSWFWEHDFAAWGVRNQVLDSRSTLNKILRFLTNPRFETVVSQSPTIDFVPLIAQKRIILVPLIKDEIGEEGVKLLGTMIVSRLLDASLQRLDTRGAGGGERESSQDLFCAFIDEFALFASPTFKEMLERVRAAKISVTVMQQDLGQLTDFRLQEAVDQTGNKVTFLLTPRDAAHYAPLYAKEPQPEMADTPIPALTRRPVEKLTQTVHRNPIIADITNIFLTRLVFFSQQLEDDKLYENKGYKATRFDLKQGRFLLDQLLTDVATHRLVPGSVACSRRIAEIVLVLRGFIGFASTARYVAKMRPRYQFIEQKVRVPTGLRSDRLEGTGIYDMKTHWLSAGEEEIKEIPLDTKARVLVTQDLERLLGQEDRKLSLSLPQAKRLGLAGGVVAQTASSLWQEEEARLRSGAGAKIAKLQAELQRPLPPVPLKKVKIYRVPQVDTKGLLPAPREKYGWDWDTKYALIKLIDEFHYFQVDAVVMQCLAEYNQARFARGYVVGLDPVLGSTDETSIPGKRTDASLQQEIARLKVEVAPFDAEITRLETKKTSRLTFLDALCQEAVFAVFGVRTGIYADKNPDDVIEAEIGKIQKARAKLLDRLERCTDELKYRATVREYFAHYNESQLVMGKLLRCAAEGEPDPPLDGKSPQAVRNTIHELTWILQNRRYFAWYTYDDLLRFVQRHKEIGENEAVLQLLAPYRHTTFTRGFLAIKDDARTNFHLDCDLDMLTKEIKHKALWEDSGGYLYKKDLNNLRWERTKLVDLQTSERRRFYKQPLPESEIVRGYLLIQARNASNGKYQGVDFYPSIAGVHPDQAAETVWQIAEALRKQGIEEQIATVKRELSENIRQVAVQFNQNTHAKMRGTEVSVWLPQVEYAHALALLCSELNIAPEAVERMRAFALALEQLCQLLTVEENLAPLMEYSGFERGATGHKPSEADMVGAMVRELTSLEPLTAWCRIQEPSAPKGERIKKHKIEIPLPPPGLTGEALEERIQRIRIQSRQEFYTPRLQAAREIQARHTRLRSPDPGPDRGGQRRREEPGNPQRPETPDRLPGRGQGLAEDEPPKRHGV